MCERAADSIDSVRGMGVGSISRSFVPHVHALHRVNERTHALPEEEEKEEEEEEAAEAKTASTHSRASKPSSANAPAEASSIWWLCLVWGDVCVVRGCTRVSGGGAAVGLHPIIIDRGRRGKWGDAFLLISCWDCSIDLEEGALAWID